MTLIEHCCNAIDTPVHIEVERQVVYWLSKGHPWSAELGLELIIGCLTIGVPDVLGSLLQ